MISDQDRQIADETFDFIERSEASGNSYEANLPKAPGRAPELLDARRGPVDHACRGAWRYAGLNTGGHEVYACDSGAHVIIAAHVVAGHECAPGCADASKGRELLGRLAAEATS